MATQPDPGPDIVPEETPAQVPDEIVPGGGDIDHPDSSPSEQPGAPGVDLPQGTGGRGSDVPGDAQPM